MPDTDKGMPSPARGAGRQAQIAAWTAVAGAFLVLFVTGHFQYAFGVFVKPMIDMFGWSRAAIASILSVRSVVTAVLSPIGGGLADKYGPRRLMLLGILLYVAGYLAASRATSLWQFYLSFGLLIGMSNSVIFTPSVLVVVRWFGKKSARANGIAMSGLSTAQAVFPPVAAFLIVSYGWESSLIILGAGTAVLGMFSWGLVKVPSETEPAIGNDRSRDAETHRDFTLMEAARTRSFWIIFAIMVVSAICFQMVAVHIVVAAVDLGVEVGAAAAILTVMGIFSTVGRLTLSGLADRMGGRTVVSIALGLQAVTLFVLARAADARFFYVTAALFGLLYGSMMPVIPSLTGAIFGTRSLGGIFGMMNFGYLGGAAVGPFGAGYLFDVTGSYYMAFVLGAGLAAIAFVLCLMLKPPRKVPIA